MTVLFQQLDNLPQPPGNLVDSVIDQWIKKYGTFDRYGSFPNISMDLRDSVKAKIFQRVSTFDPITHEIGAWLKDNIFRNIRQHSDWILRVSHIHWQAFKKDQLIEIYEKHLDSRNASPLLEDNSFVLIYNITDSIGDFVIYQEAGKPLIRTEDRPVYKKPTDEIHQLPHETLKFNDCIEIERHRPMPRTWYLSRIDVIHAVENSNQIPRVALQIRLTESEARNLMK